MLLDDIQQLTESIGDLLRYIRQVYDKDVDRMKAAQYLAYIMVYCDLDRDLGDSNPIHIDNLLEPGVRPTMNVIRYLSRKCQKEPKICHKVDALADRYMSKSDGKRLFDYHFKKMDTYFTNRKNERSNN